MIEDPKQQIDELFQKVLADCQDAPPGRLKDLVAALAILTDLRDKNTGGAATLSDLRIALNLPSATPAEPQNTEEND